MDAWWLRIPPPRNARERRTQSGCVTWESLEVAAVTAVVAVVVGGEEEEAAAEARPAERQTSSENRLPSLPQRPMTTARSLRARLPLAGKAMRQLAPAVGCSFRPMLRSASRPIAC